MALCLVKLTLAGCDLCRYLLHMRSAHTVWAAPLCMLWGTSFQARESYVCHPFPA